MFTEVFSAFINLLFASGMNSNSDCAEEEINFSFLLLLLRKSLQLTAAKCHRRRRGGG